MSDLDRAVDARIDAHRPEHVPPFEAIQARRARRNRTRTAGGAVLSVFAVAGIAFGATTLDGGGSDRLPSYAGPADGQQDVSRASFRRLTREDGTYRLNTALVEGVIGGDPQTGCLWLSGARAREGRVPLIVLSDTAAADFTTSPFVIRNNGQVTATEGQSVALTGGYAPGGFDGAVPGCPATGNAFAGVLSTDEGAAGPAPGTKFVPAPFAVKEVTGDRAAVTIVVAGVGGGCTGQARASVSDTAEGLVVRAEVSVPEDDNTVCGLTLPMQPLTVELPRPLRQDEPVLGQCLPDETTPEGRQCSATHAQATLPSP